MSIIQGNSIESGVSTYQIERSLRFNSADSAYLNRTFSTPTSGSKFTYSFWIKRGILSGAHEILGTVAGDGYHDDITFNPTTGQTLSISAYSGVDTRTCNVYATAEFRDPSAWYHFIVAVDTTQATDTNKVKMYQNGIQLALTFSTTPSQNLVFRGFNANGVVHRIGTDGNSAKKLDGYLTEVNFIDGSALDPTSFGEYNSDTGVWQPIRYSGSYGTNGFYLDFADNSSTSALGYDAAGSNDWTPNNFSVTAGAGNDSLVDTPTPYGTDTGAGGEVRGNYATLNPLDKNSAVTTVNGNLQYTSSNDRIVKATFGVTSGKWYWEFSPGGGGSTSGCGVINPSVNIHATVNLNIATAGVSYLGNGNKSVNGTASSYGATYTSGDVIGVALDLTANTVTYYKNNSSQGAISLTSGLEWFPAFDQNTGTNTVNFGQRPFAYTAPSGFKALCTQNLPEPTVVDGSTNFTVKLHTGTGAQQSITGIGFAPDLRWAKSRSNAYSHLLHDNVRGETKYLQSNTTNSENTLANMSLDADGFTVHADDLGESVVSWLWKAGGTGVSNTAGTIASTVSANTTAGFSIVTYTGNGTNGATVGHGLGVAPKLIIVKRRTTAGASWLVYHANMAATPQNNFLVLNATDAVSASALPWNNTAPTSTVITLGTSGGTNNNTDTFVAYVFAPVEGYSAFGSYTGNGSADGPFVYTGFRPRWIMFKRTDAAASWVILDSERLGYNEKNALLYANLSNAEDSTIYHDILSNGFKARTTTGNSNTSGATYIWAAFAESPFKHSLAR